MLRLAPFVAVVAMLVAAGIVFTSGLFDQHGTTDLVQVSGTIVDIREENTIVIRVPGGPKPSSLTGSDLVARGDGSTEIEDWTGRSRGMDITRLMEGLPVVATVESAPVDGVYRLRKLIVTAR